MARLALTAGLLLASAAVALAQSLVPLPPRRIVLYKSGVGYFVHAGRVAGNRQWHGHLELGSLPPVARWPGFNGRQGTAARLRISSSSRQ